MCGLAELLHNMGATVSGSDLNENHNTERLKNLGIKIFKGHNGDQVKGADVVVFSSAVKSENAELVYARAHRIPMIPRAEALYEIMRLKRGIAVAGTHGKTTTTSLVASVFIDGQTDPTVFVGGRYGRINSTALLGKGPWMVAEADESDGSFAKLSPEIAIITNIDSDHLDYFKSFENLQKAFYQFALKIPFYGVCIVCGDEPSTRELFSSFPKRILFYGFESSNDYQVKGEKGKYEIWFQGRKYADFELSVPGRHNALNAVAAFLAGQHAGISDELCRQGLLNFEGVDRRFQLKGEAQGVFIYDDYGHHPTEVRAVLQAFREKYPEQKIKVVFQPHRYSRTQSCWHEFTQCFALADEVYLLDIYQAGEAPLDGIHSERLSKEIKHDRCYYMGEKETAVEKLTSLLRPGDVLLTLGAGDGWKVGQTVLDVLRKV